jgi:hypothetical protein
VPSAVAPSAKLQVWQSTAAPPQGVLQQNPSTQYLLAHSPPDMQGVPFTAKVRS